MRISRSDIPAKIEIPGAIARQTVDFGDATAYGSLAAEYFSLRAGTDIAPLLEGVEGDACDAPHWGYMLSGEVVVTYVDGTEDTSRRQRPVLLACGTQPSGGERR